MLTILGWLALLVSYLCFGRVFLFFADKIDGNSIDYTNRGWEVFFYSLLWPMLFIFCLIDGTQWLVRRQKRKKDPFVKPTNILAEKLCAEMIQNPHLMGDQNNWLKPSTDATPQISISYNSYHHRVDHVYIGSEKLVVDAEAIVRLSDTFRKCQTLKQELVAAEAEKQRQLKALTMIEQLYNIPSKEKIHD